MSRHWLEEDGTLVVQHATDTEMKAGVQLNDDMTKLYKETQGFTKDRNFRHKGSVPLSCFFAHPHLWDDPEALDKYMKENGFMNKNKGTQYENGIEI